LQLQRDRLRSAMPIQIGMLFFRFYLVTVQRAHEQRDQTNILDLHFHEFTRGRSPDRQKSRQD
jgi:hypothetical protein